MDLKDWSHVSRRQLVDGKPHTLSRCFKNNIALPKYPSWTSFNYPLSISQVDLLEDRVQSWSRLAPTVLIPKDGRVSHLQPQLLDPLGVVDGQQEASCALLRPKGRQEGEVLWKLGLWKETGGERLVKDSKGHVRGGEVVGADTFYSFRAPATERLLRSR